MSHSEDHEKAQDHLGLAEDLLTYETDIPLVEEDFGAEVNRAKYLVAKAQTEALVAIAHELSALRMAVVALSHAKPTVTINHKELARLAKQGPREH